MPSTSLSAPVTWKPRNAVSETAPDELALVVSPIMRYSELATQGVRFDQGSIGSSWLGFVSANRLITSGRGKGDQVHRASFGLASEALPPLFSRCRGGSLYLRQRSALTTCDTVRQMSAYRHDLSSVTNRRLVSIPCLAKIRVPIKPSLQVISRWKVGYVDHW
ncbi:hypothetical protein LZ30DRAFT_66090 [Colletotrichum cereale]|nr:hypothetical protein LZ30DRAFT_66090 [Colletotrichum cereale]